MLRRLFSERPLRLPRLRPYVPKPTDPAIFWFNSERDDIVADVARRVCAVHSTNREAMEMALNDAAYHEIRRLEVQKDVEASERLGYWRSMLRRIAKMDDTEKRRVLESIVQGMARDVAGNFDPRVYRLARQAVPRLIAGVMEPARLRHDFLSSADTVLRELLSVEGDVETLRGLQSKGSLVFVPTHSSNLDSIVLAQALDFSGLPPVVYGAGKNLFTNPIISFFMHNLGAYRVDRRVRVALYKEVLKTYAQVMVERGYHSLFFPGGTRSRSGMIEQRLKLGLLGSAVAACSHNQVRRVDRPVFFVPTTINYALVLEAETLVEDWLSDEGKARFIIEDDEFSQIDRWFSFFRKVVGLRGACIIRFGKPIDAFGNPVDDVGHSVAPDGRVIDPRSYVTYRGEATLDPKRDGAYTRALGGVLARQYREQTVVTSTQLVAHALFRRLVKTTPDLDLFGRIRMRSEVAIERSEFTNDLGETRDRLLDLARQGEVHASPLVRQETPDELLDRALTVWNGYHTKTAATYDGRHVTICDPSLVLYYQNRLNTFAEDIAKPSDCAAAREIALIGVHR